MFIEIDAVLRTGTESLSLTIRQFKPLQVFGAATLAASLLLPLPVRGLICGVPNICPFHLLTGYPCPVCGITRSFVYFAHGKFSDSFAYHPLGPLLFVALLIYTLTTGFNLRIFTASQTLIHRVEKSTLLVLAAIMILVWVFRISGVIPVPADL